MDAKRRPADPGDTAAPVMFVPRGRTVMRDGRPHGPGTALEIQDPEERAHLIRSGFLVSEPPVPEAMTALESATQNPSNIGLQTQQVKFQGPVYTR
jgi:hypothetical protein